jgi:hypothetical protein
MATVIVYNTASGNQGKRSDQGKGNGKGKRSSDLVTSLIHGDLANFQTNSENNEVK